MIFFPYAFEAPIEYYDFGTMAYTVVYLPRELERELPLDEYPRLRINGEVADRPIEGAWQPGGERSDGRWYLMVPRKFMQQASLSLGDEVEVRFEIADQDHVDVPAELRAALDQNDAARAAWAQLTPGKQRGLAYRVDSAKRAETRARRVAEVLGELEP